jgi:biotin carboxyl carrier protein
MSQYFREVLLPILEELNEHDFDEAVIESPEATIAIRFRKSQLTENAGAATVFAPKAGNIEFAPEIRNGARIVAGDELAMLQVLDEKLAIRAGTSGTITSLLSEPGDFVEYGQPLLEISAGS